MASVNCADVPRAIRAVTQTALTDLARQRVEVISFFLLGLLACAGVGALHDDLPWNDPHNSAYFKSVVPIYLNPEFRVMRSPEGYARYGETVLEGRVIHDRIGCTGAHLLLEKGHAGKDQEWNSGGARHPSHAASKEILPPHPGCH
jgi:hypothetical protein